VKHPWQVADAPISERQSFFGRQPKGKCRLEKIASRARRRERIRELATDSGVRDEALP
jgi:hypothetical protein